MSLSTMNWKRGLLRLWAVTWIAMPANAAFAETPCDFKGLSVGDKLSPAEAMAALGIRNYKTNPKNASFEQLEPNVEKYGIIAASEIEDWKIGPYCHQTSCNIPYGVYVGNNDIPVSVSFSISEGRITEIDVSFNETYWDELLPILDNKYGAAWEVERTKLLITDLETKKGQQVERIFLNHTNGGRNRKTNDKCQIWANNFDVIFKHHDPLGSYHSQLVIKLVSKNF